MTQTHQDPAPFTIGVRWELPFGTCVGVRLPADDWVPESVLSQLPLPEQTAARAHSPKRRAGWVGGRMALRAALGTLIEPSTPILSTARGAPALPQGAAGSISHKGVWAVALAGTRGPEHWELGVDVEKPQALGRDISSRVLTERERGQLAGLEPQERWRQLLLRFSAKESIYKALDPHVQRYVGFHEVEVDPLSNGEGRVRFLLQGGEGPFEVQLQWREWEAHLLTCARIRRIAP